METIINFIGVGRFSAILCFITAALVYYFYDAQQKLKKRCTYEVTAECVERRNARKTYDERTKSHRISYIYSYIYFFNGEQYKIEDGFFTARKLEVGHKRRFFVNPEKPGMEREFWDGGEHSLSEGYSLLLLGAVALFCVVGVIALIK